jgi:hypothetical protein
MPDSVSQKMMAPEHRLSRMRKSFEKDKSIFADDYIYFATPMPRASIPQNKVARMSAERRERQSPKRSERPSSDKSDD